MLNMVVSTATIFLLLASGAAAQVQCLIPTNDQNGTLTFENDCADDVTVEIQIGNPDFSDDACYTALAEGYPCQGIVRSGGTTVFEIPIGELQGAYRACYTDEVGTAICEFD